jgi:hypothetical protein
MHRIMYDPIILSEHVLSFSFMGIMTGCTNVELPCCVLWPRTARHVIWKVRVYDMIVIT